MRKSPKAKGEKPAYTKAQLALVVAFCAAIGVLFALLMILPKHAGEVSQLEFRALAEYPYKSAGKVKSASAIAEDVVRGRFSANTDSFLEDHFPGRTFFIALNSYYLRLSGRNADQSVVWGKNGRLIDEPLVPDETKLSENAAKLEEFASENGLESAWVFIPSAAIVCEDDLPLLHLDCPDYEMIASLAEQSTAFVPDVAAIFKSQAEPGDMLYHTDHHWTMEGAYAVYSYLCSDLGVAPTPKEAFTVEDYEFYGSFYREAGLWLTRPDRLEVWRNPALDNAAVTVGWGESAVTHTGVYDPEKLKEGETDKYAAYVYSNNGVTVIENPEAEGGSILIVKDSFGNSIAPLLATNYSTVVMIDTRYYRGVAVKPSELIAQYGIERMVVVMGADSVNSECELVYLR